MLFFVFKCVEFNIPFATIRYSAFFFFLLTFTPAETCQQLLLASSNPTREDLNVPQYPFPPLFHGIRQQKQSQTNSGNDNRGNGWAGSSSSHHWPALLPELQRCTKPSTSIGHHPTQRLQQPAPEENEVKAIQTLLVA